MTQKYRAAFDLPRDICYLNAAYMTPQPRAVLEAAVRGAARRARPWTISPPDFFSDVEALRSAFARQIGCTADHVAVVPSAGYGVACAANNLRTTANDIILAMGDQFPSNYYSWRRQALASGAEIEAVSKENGQTWAEALLEAIATLGDRIALATLEGHHWASAEAVDLELVIPALREVGAKVVLDLTQTIGACPLDINRLKPDFMVAAAYKWQFCPYGVAFLYVDEEYFDGVPIEEAWMDRDGAEDFSRLAEFTDRYQPGARRYDVSEKCSFSNIAGSAAALQLLEAWGIENIASELRATNQRIATILEAHGFETMSSKRRGPHFQSARLPETDPRELAARLIDHHVFASVRGDHLRVAPHLYTDEADLERFDAALGSVKA
ncbi:MAG: aminotransferase class V-fold PLP-dependent enzyme [Woeseiaceae bacterium]|nr:aminotransferase class V-fold PLP-dependent enzyme [Woeseiaceae bacterium]